MQREKSAGGDEAKNGDEQEGQRRSTGFVEPAANRRPEHEPKVRAGHDEADHASALVWTEQIGNEREADAPRDRVASAGEQPRRQPGRGAGECQRHAAHRARRDDGPADHRQPIGRDTAR